MRTLPSALLATLSVIPLSFSTSACASHHENAPADVIAAAVAEKSRTPENVARDAYRHPAETLAFFGVTPEQTVVELIPGGGWYTEILAPLLRDKGKLYALQPQRGIASLGEKLAANPAAYGTPVVLNWPSGADDIPAGSVDTVLTFRNIHNLVIGGTASAAFATFFRLLKPGGTLGMVDHRLPEDRDVTLEKSSGYLKLSTVRKLAEDAGFVLEAQSEINANPKDSADWEKGVWTLPPSLRNGDTDKERYLAIGESDRMTLRFRKPVQ